MPYECYVCDYQKIKSTLGKYGMYKNLADIIVLFVGSNPGEQKCHYCGKEVCDYHMRTKIWEAKNKSVYDKLCISCVSKV